MQSIATPPAAARPRLIPRIDASIFGKLDRGAIGVWVLAGGLVLYLGLDGGGYDPVVHSRVSVLVWWIVLVGMALGLLPAARPTRSAWWAAALFGGFVAWTALTSTSTLSTERSLADLSLVAGYLGVLVLALSLHRDRGRALRHTMAAVATAIVVIAALAVLSRLRPDLFPAAQQTGSFLLGTQRRLAWPLNYWNALAALAALGIPLLLGLATSARTLRAQAASAAGIPVLVLCAYLTFSRGGAVAIAAAAVAFIALAPERLPKLATALLAAAGGAVMAYGAAHRSAIAHGLANDAARRQGGTLLLVALLVCTGVALTQAGVGLAVRHGTPPRWPGLTLLALGPKPAGDLPQRIVAAAARQTCADFELIVSNGSEPWPGDLGRRLQVVPGTPSSLGRCLAEKLPQARGRYVLATSDSDLGLLQDPSLVEKTLRALQSTPAVTGIAFADVGPEPLPLTLIDRERAHECRPHALCWTATGPQAPPASLLVAEQRPIDALTRWVSAHGTVQWRHLALGGAEAAAAPSGSGALPLGAPRVHRTDDQRFRHVPAALPQIPPRVRQRFTASWRPPQTRLLCRHTYGHHGRYVYTTGTTSPSGAVLDRILGVVREFPLPGTSALVLLENEGRFAFDAQVEPYDPRLLGFVDQTSLPLFDELLIGRRSEAGDWVLVAGHDDPLLERLREAKPAGYVEPHPLRPRRVPQEDVMWGLVGLLRSVDLHARRHRYAAGKCPPGLDAGELGALFVEATGDCAPLWIDDDGRVFTSAAREEDGRPSLRSAIRWAGAPLTWTNFGRTAPRMRASVRRAYELTQLMTSDQVSPPRPEQPTGYLLQAPTPGTVPLYAATHPVTRDQLLSTIESEASDLGYEAAVLLGHLVAKAPVTGSLGPIRRGAPWAYRFGLAVSG